MNDTPKKRRRGLWWKIPLTLILLLVVVLAVVWFRLSAIATSLANQKLPELLGVEASVERIELKPAQGLAEIHGLRIGQPDGFGDGPLLELGRVLAEVDLGSLGSEEGILVRAVEVEGLTANIAKDINGVLNALQLGPQAAETTVEEDDSAVPSEEGGSVEANAEAPAPFPGLRIGRVAITKVAVTYQDRSTGEKPIDIVLGNLDVQLRDGRISLADGPAVRLGEGSVTLEDIRIAQPAGFGEDALLDLPRLHLDVGTEPFVDQVVRLQRLEVEGLRASISRDNNGVMNVARLGGGPPPPPPAPKPEAEAVDEESDDASVVEVEAELVDETPAGSPVGIHLQELALVDFGVTYRDAALGGDQPFESEIRELNLSVTNLMAFLQELPAASSPVTLEAAIVQGEHPAAQLSLFAALGPIAGGIPDVNVQMKLTGFMLDTLGELVPPGVRQTVGADGMDVQARLALTASHIDLSGRAETDAGHGYPFGVKGSLDGPKVDLGPIGMAVAGRLTGGVANLATGAAGAAVDIASGVAGGATDVAAGAKDAVGAFGSGLLKSAKAAMTLDVKEVRGGLKEATVDVAQGAGDTVKEAGGTMADQAKEGAGSMTGSKATVSWQEAIGERHRADAEAACAALKEMPFPPVPPDAAGKGEVSEEQP